jgi:NTE family protein
MARTLTGVARNAWSRDKGSVNHALKQSTFRGLLDTAPLKPYLRDLIPWQQIPLNIKNGFLKAVTVTATNVHSGEVELFVQKAENIVYSGRYKIHDVPLESVHAIASAAIPILFPSVSIGGQHYCDGGLRLNTPMSPAIQLGADKVLVIGLHHQREKADWHNAGADNLKNTMPTLGELLGQVLKTVFVDRLDYDINQTNRLNLVIETAEHVYGADFLQKMNGALLERSIRRDIALRGLKKLDMYSIFPSQDIREIFRDCLEDAETMKEGLTTFEKWLLRVLDVDLVQGLDFLTFILFIPKYISKLLDLGFEDARHHHDKLVEFLGSA